MARFDLIKEYTPPAGAVLTFYSAGSAHDEGDKIALFSDRDYLVSRDNPITLGAEKQLAVYFAETTVDLHIENAIYGAGGIWLLDQHFSDTDAAIAAQISAEASAVATAADRVQTAADRVQTGLDVTAANAGAAAATGMGYPTRALMDAAAGLYTEGQVVRVTNDPTPANNGDWIKGVSVFTPSSFDRVAVVEKITNPIDGVFTDDEVGDYAFVLVDATEKMAFGIRDDGTVEIGAMEADTINGKTGAEFTAAVASGSLTEITNVDGYAYAVVDDEGRAAFAIKDDGTIAVKDFECEQINGTAIGDFARVAPPPPDGNFSAELIFINNTGQSLGEGSNGTITTAQEYDNVGFPAYSTAPTELVVLTVGNTQVAGRGESPMYGALGHIKELIQDESGLAYTEHGYQMAACNNAYSGYSINALKKGTTPYANAMAQILAAYNIAQAEGRTFKVGAILWTQGEADGAMPFATYRDLLKQLAEDYDTDSKAITGQTEDVVLISYQTGTGSLRNVQLAQMAAAAESIKVVVACPMYQFSYYDAQHIDAAGAKWLGGYYGLAYKRTLIDGAPWEPLQPISHTRQGAILTVNFNPQVRPLMIDTTLVPAQVNAGFSMVDSGGGALTISSVSVVGPSMVKIVAAASIPSGAKLRYGFNAAVGKGPYLGGCGNLRDSQGASIVYSAVAMPMHNWCTFFEYQL